MDGYRWLWMVTDGYGWLQMVMDGYGWLWMVMDGYGSTDRLEVQVFLGSVLLKDVRQPVMPLRNHTQRDDHGKVAPALPLPRRLRCFRRVEDVRPLMPLQMATPGAKAIFGQGTGRIVKQCTKNHLGTS